jgi:membrane protease subunit HflC
MRASRIAAAASIVVALGVIGLSLSAYTVDQRERALLLQFGQPVGGIIQPGLHFKLPVIQTVRRFDTRILSVDPPAAQMVISSSGDNPVTMSEVTTPKSSLVNALPAANDKADAPDLVSGEPIVVDTFGRYHITDPLAFMKALGTIDIATLRIDSIMNDATRAVLRGTAMRQLLSPQRAQLMEQIRAIADGKAQKDNLGIKIDDVRIVRADLTQGLRESTVKRMISQLQERATETRAKGDQNAQQIQAAADKERTVLLAQASSDATAIKGDGDRQAAAIYAGAYNKDKGLYTFLRTIDAYKKSMTSPDTRLILSPDDAFLKLFKDGPVKE